MSAAVLNLLWHRLHVARAAVLARIEGRRNVTESRLPLHAGDWFCPRDVVAWRVYARELTPAEMAIHTYRSRRTGVVVNA
jgi:hypothetical protein